MGDLTVRGGRASGSDAPFLPFLALLLLVAFLAWGLGDVVLVRPDSLFLLAYLRSPLQDGDLVFHNEYENLGLAIKWGAPTACGYAPNQGALGTAILWAPFYLAGHWAARSLVPASTAKLAGFNWPHLLACAVGTLVLGFLTLFLCYRLACVFASPWWAFFATLMVALGTPFFNYLAVNGLYSHVPSAFAVAFLLTAWVRHRHRIDPWVGLLWGACVGFAGLVRWQDLLFGLVPLTEIVVGLVQAPTEGRRERLVALACFLLGAFVVLSPQFVMWKVIYDVFVTVPQQGDAIAFPPPLFRLLFSGHHGLFTWTPLFLLVVPGLIALKEASRSWFLVVTCGMTLQLLADSAFHWWGGLSFGVRRITDCTVLVVVALACLVGGGKGRRRLWAVPAALAAAWALLLCVQFRGGLLPREEPLTFSSLALHQVRGLRILPEALTPPGNASPLLEAAGPAAFPVAVVAAVLMALAMVPVLKKALESPPVLSCILLGVAGATVVSIVAIDRGTDPVGSMSPRIRALLLREKQFQEGGDRTLFDLAQAQHALGRFEACSRTVRSLLAKHPANPLLWRMLATCQVRVRQYDLAASSLEQYLRLKPRDGNGYIFYARLLFSLHRFGHARDVLAKLSKAAGKDPEYWKLRGLVDLAEGLEAEAAIAFRRAQSLNPKDTDLPRYLLGR